MFLCVTSCQSNLIQHFLLLFVYFMLTSFQQVPHLIGVNMNDRLSPESDRNDEATASSPAISLPNLPFGIGPYG